MDQDEAMQRAIDTLKPGMSSEEACKHGFMIALVWVVKCADDAARDGELLAIGNPVIVD